MLLKLTTLGVNLLGSPVEIHLAGGERESVRLGRGGRSGDMLTALCRDGTELLRAQADAEAADRGSFFLGWTAEVML